MSQPTRSPHRFVSLHLVPATVCGLVSIALLLVLPSAAAADPTLGAVPSTGEALWWTVAAVLLLQALGVAWVGRFPTSAVMGLAALPLVLVWAAPGVAFTVTVVAELAGVFLAVVARPPRRRLWVALGTTALLLAVGQFGSEVRSSGLNAAGAVTAALLQAAIVVGLPLLLGLVIAAQRDAHDARHHEVQALRREQDALLQAAVSQQRMAMSRELHDIAAHQMSGIALMAAAMDRQIDSDPATAKGSARQIRAQSSAVLDDLRRLVGLLREEADAARPVETLTAVSALVETRRAAGAEIDLVMPAGDAESGAGVGPLAHLVAYRMVQESLANAAAHAPGARCAVEIGDQRDGRLTITVRNGVPTAADPGPGGGFGLVGMAERAQLVGADLVYGATPDGGWEVRLRLPVDDTINTTRAPAPLSEDSA